MTAVTKMKVTKAKAERTESGEVVVKTIPTEPATVEAGDVVAITFFTRVNRNHTDGVRRMLDVTDLDRGTPFGIHGDELIRAATSADRFTEEVKISRTRICEILTEHCWGVPFTVFFVKKDGEERKMRGRYVAHEKMMGRSLVEDLDLDAGERKARPRQVDHRTVKWLIVRGVKYTSNSRD